MHLFRRILKGKLFTFVSGRSEEPNSPDVAPTLIAQPLEERRVLTVGLSSLSPLAGTMNSAGYWDCEDPTISGVVDGVAIDHSVRLDFDFNGDGNPDDCQAMVAGGTTFQYDPRNVMPALSGIVDLRIRAVQLDNDGFTMLDSTGWNALPMNVIDPTLDLDTFGYAPTGTGDDYVFSGHLSGFYSSGATITLSGLFTGSTTTDSSGNFSITQAFPTGGIGYVYADALDSQGNTASSSVPVSITDPTPSFDSLAYSTIGSDDDYVFSGHLTGVYNDGATISFSGLISGTATTDSSGNFSFSQAFPTGGTGYVYANATDSHGHSASISVPVSIADPTPVLDALTYGPTGTGDDYLFSGHLTGVFNSGAVITFSGLFSGSTTTDASGIFSFTQSFPTGGVGYVYANALDSHGHSASNSVPVSIADPTPVLDTLTYAFSGTGDDYVFSGHLTGVYNAGATINFSGLISGTATTDSSGNFSFSQAFPTGGIGYVYAAALDSHGHSASNSVPVSITDPTPILGTFNYAFSGTGDDYVFSGHLTGVYNAGAAISFSGLFTGTTTTDSSGNFSFTQAFPIGGAGYVYAAATDSYGHTASNSVPVSIVDPTPMLDSLTYSPTGTADDYVFSGHLMGVYNAGAAITFSGLFSGTATTDASGNFSFVQAFPTGGTGYISANALDSYGHSASNSIPVNIVDPTPVLDGLTYSAIGMGDDYVFSGHLTGVYNDGATISFSGLISGTATTDSSGNFSFSQAFPTGGTGYVYANATDSHGHSASISVPVSIADPTPVLDALTYGPTGTGDDYLFSGHLTGVFNSGAVITFSGLFSGSTTTDASGIFSFTQSFPTGGVGYVYADALDSHGHAAANSVSVSIADPTPILDSLTYAPIGTGDDYVFSGHLTGVYNAGAAINFSGLISGTATTDSSGNFSFSQAFPTGGTGYVYANATDSHGHSASNSVPVNITDPTLVLDTFSYAPIGTADDYLFSGHLSGVFNSGAVINFSGLFSGTTTTDSSGNFSFTQAFPTGGSGYVYANALDTHGHGAVNSVSVSIIDPTPVIDSLDYSPTGTGDDYLFSGHLTGVFNSGAVITFSGLFSGSTTTDASGIFSFTQSFPTGGVGYVYANSLDSHGHSASNSVPVSIADPTPVLDTLTYAFSGTGDDYVFSGHLTGVYNAGATINFSGLISGTATTDSSGNFSFSQAFPTGGIGYVYAAALDSHGHSASNSVPVSITDPTPILGTFNYAFSGTGDDYVFSGHLTGVYNAGAAISFSGLFTGTTTTDSSGNFSFTQAFPIGGVGYVYAAATDSYGHTASNSVPVSIVDPTPMLDSLTYSPTGTADDYVFSGHLMGVYNAGAAITFSGLFSGTAVTDYAGNFSFTQSFPTGGIGYVCAAALDSHGHSASISVPVSIADPTPVLDALTYGPTGTGDDYLFSGHLTGVFNSGAVITFSGLFSGSTTTDASGIFSFTQSFPTGGLGYVYADALDSHGHTASNSVPVSIEDPTA